MTIWTIGHSARTIEEFTNLLISNKIEALADIRRFPISRRYPHFNKDNLKKFIGEHHIDYLGFPQLGGHRIPRPDSINTALEHQSFRGYADYMETIEFKTQIKYLLDKSREGNLAIMCAEGSWQSCHRALAADSLKVSGEAIIHIVAKEKTEHHVYTSGACFINGKLSYTAAEEKQYPLF